MRANAPIANAPGSPKDALDAPPPYPRRFGWPMRVFLTFLIFSLTYRCFGILLPMSDWASHFGVEELPKGLPSPTERAELRAHATDDDPHPVAGAFQAAGESLVDYCKPWPSAKARQRIDSPAKALEWALCWVNFRLQFLERVVGIEEQFMMFAPSVDKVKVHVRARLFYGDGSDRVVRQNTEPEDYTRGGHWWEDRVTSYEYRVFDYASRSKGWCNLLAHRYPERNGAKLERIVLFYVPVYLPEPGADALAHYREQQRLNATPPRRPGCYGHDWSNSERIVGHDCGDYYEYDPAAGEGES